MGMSFALVDLESANRVQAVIDSAATTPLMMGTRKLRVKELQSNFILERGTVEGTVHEAAQQRDV
ncbi:unnamed protein product [Arabis nemorensis]|uniref:Uncharacterized protein n=1 Tax=Arabis nemorensis TaxID=586526 RepID=A0A565BE92_9BRAS|nr:unnamed protein product [Arabis nemorensis]